MRALEHIDEWYGAGRDAAISGGRIADVPALPDPTFLSWISGFREYQFFDPGCPTCFGSGRRRADEAPGLYSMASIPCDCNVGAPTATLHGAMPLPAGWVEAGGASAVALERELRRELCPTHQLANIRLILRARRTGRDDVLMCRRGEVGPVFCVHLTWHVESDPTWPWTEQYEDLHDFATRWPKEDGEANEADEGCH